MESITKARQQPAPRIERRNSNSKTSMSKGSDQKTKRIREWVLSDFWGVALVAT